MSAKNFTSLHDIRREAGLLRQTTDKHVIGEVDGANRVFYASQAPIVDRDGDDEVTKADVTAYVDDDAVAIESVDAATGAVVLAAAPKPNARVILAYEFSAIEQSEIERRRQSAEDWLKRKVSRVYNWAALDMANFPDVWEDAVRLYAAALLQISDWGTNVDVDGSSKDGYMKLKTAKQMLDEWVEDAANLDPTDPNIAAATSGAFASDGDLVGRIKGNRAPLNPEVGFFNKRR